MKFSEDAQRHFQRFGFEWQEGGPIVSANPKLLFNISGGVVFEEAICYGAAPTKRRVVSVQTCLRTDGWEKIGLSGRHHLAFDMLGHFSLYENGGRETKELMIESAWRYLTDFLEISSNSLSATVHPGDHISSKIWESLGVKTVLNDGNISHTPARNRCGTRTEIVWKNPSTQRSIELWNLVFTEFEGTTLFECPLSTIAADSGASIDRIVTAVECCSSDYDNSNWKSVVSFLSELSRINDRALACRLADLGKAATLLMGEGLRPGNRAAEYVLRKIIREALVLCQQASIPVGDFATVMAERWDSSQTAQAAFVEEAARFEKALDRGRKELAKLSVRRNGPLTEQDVEYLASTFGFPKTLIKFGESKRETGEHNEE